MNFGRISSATSGPARAALNHFRSFALVKAGGKVTGVQGSRGRALESGSAKRHAVWARSSGLEANVLVPPVLEGVGMQYPINHFC